MTVIVAESVVDVWVAYCVPCGCEIYRAKKRARTEAIAREHVKATEHTVLVGFEVKAVT